MYPIGELWLSIPELLELGRCAFIYRIGIETR